MVRRVENGLPDYPTCVRARLSDGRLLGTDGSMWLYRAVPLNPVVDAASPHEAIAAAEPIMAAFDELAALAHVGVARRMTAKSSYRQVHLLLMNVPTRFSPPKGHPIGDYLQESFSNQAVDRRVLLMGVRIIDKVTSGGLKQAVESVKETILAGSIPLEDFESDTRAVSAAMGRAGMLAASDADLRLASSWWTHGDRPDVVSLEHASHLHIFRSAEDARPAAEAGRDCSSEEWEALDQYALSFASVQGFDFDVIPAESPQAWWVPRLMQSGAVVVSIRGGIEPAKVTRAELRRRKKQFMDDLAEAAQNNKMERAEQSEALARLDQAEAMYSMDGAPPVLTDASVLVALDGRVADIDEYTHSTGLHLKLMDYRQLAAMSETWPCSNIRANPHLHDLPAQTIACSGLPSISRVGDADGAMLGLTEMDRQPAFLSPTAAAKADSLPICSVAGATGSGKTMVLLWLADQYARIGHPVVIVDPKALTLDTPVPTPSGWSTIAEIEPGDRVLGRDGRPCNVTHKSRVFSAAETDLFEFVFDDGQVIRADANHQWVVYANNDRSRLLRASQADVAGWKGRLMGWSQEVSDLASSFGDSHESGTYELLGILRDAGVTRWADAKSLGGVLRRGGIEPEGAKPAMWPTALAMKVVSRALAIGSDAPYGQVLSSAEIIERGVHRGGQSRFAVPISAAVELPEGDLPIDPYLFGVWLGDGSSSRNEITCATSDTEAMLSNIEQAWPLTTVREVRPTTQSISLDRDFGRCLYGHSDYTVVQRSKDQTAVRCATCESEHRRALRNGSKRQAPEMVNPSFIHLLNRLGVRGNKHIPAEYLRSSRLQRLALLQGLMDTDGTVKSRGDLRITLTNRRLIHDVLELVRSLGYKANIWEGPARLTEPDPDHPGQTRIREVGREWVVTFRTSDPVFRLPRKAADQAQRCGSTTPLRSRFNYLVDVRPVPSAPAQCLRVDSQDHTYLVGGFVPTHNSGSDHTAAVTASGGQVASLDDLARADGVFDPLRFAMSKEAGVDMASSLLSAVNPWGSMSSDYETPLISSLRYGTDNGATCIGEALQIAERGGKAPAEMVRAVFDLAEASPMFRACMGIDPKTDALRIAEGITLIKVGTAHLELPEPGTSRHDLTPQQRVCLALVRMMVFGSAAALTGRQGVVMLDEAWVFTGAGKSEVERLGRLARSQGVLPMLFTQRVSDAVNAGLAGYISRGLILPIQDKVEAQAACEMFELEPTPERMSRITSRATIGSTDGGTAAPNWNSMRHLRDPRTGATLRGSVAIYADIHGRAVPVEVIIPQSFMDRASTNPDDIRRREAALAAGDKAQHGLPAEVAMHGPGGHSASPGQPSVPDRPSTVHDFDFDFGD